MKVLIIEFGGSHIECTYTYLHYLHERASEVYLACNEGLLDFFPERNLLAGHVCFPDKLDFGRQIKAFLKLRNFIKEKGITNLIINTVEIKPVRNFMFFIPWGVYCAGLVHHAKKLERSTTFRLILSLRMRKYLVLGNHLLESIRPYDKFQVFPYYPVYFPKPVNILVTKPAGQKWIVVPGVADMGRRDYMALLSCISENRLPDGMKFVFLGQNCLHGSLPMEWIDSDWWDRHIITFEGKVEYDLFHSYLLEADAILPLVKMENDSMYGSYRISGSVNLGLGYQKPFLLPYSMRNNKDLAPYSLYYSTMKELIDLVADTDILGRDFSIIQKSYSSGIFGQSDKMGIDFFEFISGKYAR